MSNVISRTAIRAMGWPCAADVDPAIVAHNMKHPLANIILFHRYPLDKDFEAVETPAPAPKEAEAGV